jgi:Domain of unknown function (DUF4149)
MTNFSDKLALIAITLWVGALWAIGMVAYVLFDTLSDKQMAGMLAGKLFTIVAYIGIVSAFYLLIHRLMQSGTTALKQGFFWAVLLMLLLTLAEHFGIEPILAELKNQAMPADVMQSVFADRFKTWHGVASIAYLLECLLGLIPVLRAR